MKSVEILITIDSDQPSSASGSVIKADTLQTVKFKPTSALLSYLRQNPTQAVSITLTFTEIKENPEKLYISALSPEACFKTPKASCDISFAFAWYPAKEDNDKIQVTSSGTIIVRPPVKLD